MAAKKKKATDNTKKGSGALGMLLFCIAAAAILAMSVRAFGFELVVVRSDAMGPTLQPGDVVLVSRVAQPEIGNIVLAGAKNGSAFRRIAAEPGDQVAASGGTVWRNGAPLDEPYAWGEMRWDIPRITLEDDVYLLLADNRAHESALVARGGIAGTVRALVWPVSRAGFF